MSPALENIKTECMYIYVRHDFRGLSRYQSGLLDLLAKPVGRPKQRPPRILNLFFPENSDLEKKPLACCWSWISIGRIKSITYAFSWIFPTEMQGCSHTRLTRPKWLPWQIRNGLHRNWLNLSPQRFVCFRKVPDNMEIAEHRSHLCLISTPKWHWLQKSKSGCGLLRQPRTFRVHAIEWQWSLNNLVPPDRWEDKEISSMDRDRGYNPVLWRS